MDLKYFFQNLSGAFDLLRTKGISRLTKQIHDFEQSLVGSLPILNDKSDVVGRRWFVPIKLLLKASQPNLKSFFHVASYGGALKRQETGIAGWRLRFLRFELTDRNGVGFDHLAGQLPGINALKSAVHF